MSPAPMLFPLFLKVAGRRVVVVGGGPMASARVAALVEAGAEVTVVSPQIRGEIRKAGVSLVEREYRPGDLEGAWLAIAAAPPGVNREVAREAEERRIFMNAVDDPQRASAYTGGIIRRGGVLAAISTQGRAPALAGLLREAFDLLLPSDVGTWIERAEVLRQRWRAGRVLMADRRPLLLEALNELYAAHPAAPALAAAPPEAP